MWRGRGRGGLTLTLVGWSDNRFIKGEEEEEKGGLLQKGSPDSPAKAQYVPYGKVVFLRVFFGKLR